jgi:hypothetical protein
MKECHEKGSQKLANPLNTGRLTDLADQGTSLNTRLKDVNLEGNSSSVNPSPLFDPANKIRSSLDVRDMKFNDLELTSPWLEFLGEPTWNFSMVIHGLPSRKINLCIEVCIVHR